MEEEENIEEELLLVEAQLHDLQDKIKALLDHQEELYERQAQLKALLEISKTSRDTTNSAPSVPPEDWSGRFSWDSQADDIRFNVFGISSYRSNQREIINSIMSRRDALVIMAAGGGKSLCYQLPALLRDGIALVVSPLLSLIQDQVMGLAALGIPAYMLTSTTDKEVEKFIYKALDKGEGELKILYVTPEKISKSKRFMSKLEKCHHAGRLSLVAIDEAHCCSQWGHDFRPDYKNLGILKIQFPSVPMIALTATATSKVQMDLIEMLHIPRCVKFVSTVNRPNLFYKVYEKSPVGKVVIDEIANFISESYPNNESGIVYCFSRKECEQVAKELRGRGISADYYHADMDVVAREKIHMRWSKSKSQVIVGTVAFGMGINKPDVRFVVHHSLSKSMETYYQESGRAGRDGLPSECVLYYRPGDVPRQSSMVFYENCGLQNLYDIVRYCQSKRSCRRAAFFQHFGEAVQECNGMCDNCASTNELKEIDATYHTKIIVSLLQDMQLNDQRATLLQLVDKFKTKWKHLGCSDEAVDLKKEEIEQLIVQLILDRVLDTAVASFVAHNPFTQHPIPEDKSVVDFFGSNGLTTFGLQSLSDSTINGQICAIVWDTSFHVVVKNNDVLYVLQNNLDRNNIWKELTIRDDGRLCNYDFTPVEVRNTAATTSLEVQTHKCSTPNCQFEFVSLVNLNRHKKNHLSVEKDFVRKAAIATYWDQLTVEEAHDILFIRPMQIKGISGTLLYRLIEKTKPKDQFYSILSKIKVIVDSPDKISANELFAMLSKASEDTTFSSDIHCCPDYLFDPGISLLSEASKRTCYSFFIETSVIERWLSYKREVEALTSAKNLLQEDSIRMCRVFRYMAQFYSDINFNRHQQVHSKDSSADLDILFNRDDISNFWDNLTANDARLILCVSETRIQGFRGRKLMSLLKDPDQNSPIADIAGRLNAIIISTKKTTASDLFDVLDQASEGTLFCTDIMHGFRDSAIFEGHKYSHSPSLSNVLGCVSYIIERRLVQKWFDVNDAKAREVERHIVDEDTQQEIRLLMPPSLATPPEYASVGSKIFPAFVKLLNSKDPSDNSEKAVLDELRALDEHLKAHGPYINGENISAADDMLGPKLFHLQVALEHLKGWKIPKNLTNVHAYTEALFSCESFVKAMPAKEHVVALWAPMVNA